MEGTQSNWQIELLFKQSFIRTKDRIIEYFLVVVLNFLIWIAFLLGLLLLGGLVFILYNVTKSFSLIIGIGLTVSAFAMVILLYLHTWLSLLAVKIVIQEEKHGVIETFKDLKPLVWGYVWFALLSFLFLLILFPLGVVSLGIVFVLWSFWNSFSVFIYLETQQKGLNNLWFSRTMINQKFWGVAGRLLILNGAILLINILFLRVKEFPISLLVVILPLFTTPFVISYGYFMFRNLTKPEQVKFPLIWFILGVLSWIAVMILVIVLLPLLYGTIGNLNNFIQNQNILKQNRTKQQSLPSPFPSLVPSVTTTPIILTTPCAKYQTLAECDTAQHRGETCSWYICKNACLTTGTDVNMVCMNSIKVSP